MNNIMEIHATKVFKNNLNKFKNPDIRTIINIGGSRSSKTYSILQLLIFEALKDKMSISIVRNSFPALRRSVMRDFFDIIKSYNIYNQKHHSRSEHIYTFPNGSTVEFFSTDDEYKLRGTKRDILYINEANEIDFDKVNQLLIRTTNKVILDYNPSEVDCWVDNIKKDPKSAVIHSTYKDNPFLTREQIEYIESMIDIDENYYRVYALGLPPIAENKVYTHFKQYVYQSFSRSMQNYTKIYGLDYGYKHYSALISVTSKFNDTGSQRITEDYYVKEELYKQNLTIEDLTQEISKIVEECSIIYVDSARPDLIESLKRLNKYTILPAIKSVKEGIDYIKSSRIYMDKYSVNLWNEYNKYIYKSINGKITEEVIKLNDDGMDAIRYAIYSHYVNSKKSKFNFVIV